MKTHFIITTKNLHRVPYLIGFKVIRKVITAYFHITGIELDQKSRLRDVVDPRQIAHYFGAQCLNVTDKKVGYHFGGKDHATVLSSKRKINNSISTQVTGKVVDAELKDHVETIAKMIDSQLESTAPDFKFKHARRKRIAYHHKAIYLNLIHQRQYRKLQIAGSKTPGQELPDFISPLLDQAYKDLRKALYHIPNIKQITS